MITEIGVVTAEIGIVTGPRRRRGSAKSGDGAARRSRLRSNRCTVMRGKPERVAGGARTQLPGAMTMGYAQLAPERLRSAVTRL